MKKIIMIMLLFLPIVSAFQSTQECLNTTHLQTRVIWRECDGTCTDKNITQVVECTSSCDEARDECLYEKQYDNVDNGILFVLFGASGLFCFLGLKTGDKHEALRMLFTFMGLWLMLTSLSVANSIAITSGLDRVTVSGIETGLQVATWTVYVFMAYFMIMFLVTQLMRLAKSGGRVGKRR